MKIICKQCGIVLTVDSQDAELHPGLCDVCMNTVPAVVEFVPDNQPNIETIMEETPVTTTPVEQVNETQNEVQEVKPEVVEEINTEVTEEVAPEETEEVAPEEIEEFSIPQAEGDTLVVPETEPVEPSEVEEIKVEETVEVVEPTQEQA